MKLSGVAFAFAVALCVPQAVLAWNATGHELVAGIAWDNMTPAVRQKAIALLKSAPSDACLLDLFPNDARPLADREREFFMRAATWPDVVRKGKDNDTRPCTRFSDGDAHFKDHFWQGVSGATGSNAPKDRPDIAGKPDNAIVRLNASRDSVACSSGPCGADAQRATDLAWILHVVGDIHQPLHDAARASAAHPTGDQGGNGFLLSTDPKGPKLHGFWDDIVDKSIPLNAGEANQKSITYLDRVIARITADHPRPSMVSHLTPVDFEAWSEEGFETAKRVAYPVSLHEAHTPSVAYRRSVFTVADEAIALGGYRLADLLNTILGGEAVAPPPPTAGNHLPVPSHIVIVTHENKSLRDVIGTPAADDPSLMPSLVGHTTGFFGTEHCGPAGDATDKSEADPYLNALKNRDVAPDSYTPTTVAAVVADKPDALTEGPIRRDRWKNVKNAQALVPKEAKGIEVIGYLAGVTPEKEESCNCADPNHKDHHMWLVANPGEKQAKSIVVEISPRLLKDHPDWPKLASKAYRDGTQVRIRGWRTFDEEHPKQLHDWTDHSGKLHHATRNTLWEIHPIIEIDVKQGGQWVAIDGGA